MNIRRCEARDRIEVLHLLESCGLPVADLRGATLEQFLVCEYSGTVCGVAGLEAYDRDALLRSVAVIEPARGLGVGAALVTAAEAAARAKGFRAVYLLTTTAVPYFARRGWRVVDRSSISESLKASAEFASLCPASSTCMVKQYPVDGEIVEKQSLSGEPAV